MSVSHLHVGLWLCALVLLPGGNTIGIMSISAVLSNFALLSGFADWLRQCDTLGDETRPSLHDLLLQPVQRIPEYLLLLQVSSSQDLRCLFKRVNAN